MADDNLFEFLHAEIVAKLCENVENEGNLNTSVQKLERLGFVVGQKYIERCTKDIPRFKDELDTMKFICKDFWMQVYKKQIDNLRTNHHGVYNLHDYKFKFLQQLSSGNQYKDDAPKVNFSYTYSTPERLGLVTETVQVLKTV